MLPARLAFRYPRLLLINLACRPRSTMASEGVNRAAWQEEKKGPFVVKDTELWEPGENEIRLKVRLYHRPLGSCTPT